MMEVTNIEKVIEIWAEGCAMHGSNFKASKLGEEIAINFNDAVCKHLKKYPNPEIELQKNGHWYDWGCELFDNEKDARKFCG